MANVYGKGERKKAISLYEQAAQIFEKLGYKHWAAQALGTSGLWLVDIGESVKGIQRIKQSITVLHEIGDRHDKGIMLATAGQIDLAIIALDEARNVAQLTGNLNHEFNTLCKAGEAYVKVGRRVEAIKAFEDQVAIVNSMGIVSKELHALKHLADSFAEWGDVARAKAYMQVRVIVRRHSKDVHDYPDALFESATFFAGIGKIEAAILQAEFATNVFERNNDASCAMKVRFKIDEWKGAEPQVKPRNCSR